MWGQPQEKTKKIRNSKDPSTRFHVSKLKLGRVGATLDIHGVQIKYLEFLEFKGGTHDSV